MTLLNEIICCNDLLTFLALKLNDSPLCSKDHTLWELSVHQGEALKIASLNRLMKKIIPKVYVPWSVLSLKTLIDAVPFVFGSWKTQRIFQTPRYGGESCYTQGTANNVIKLGDIRGGSRIFFRRGYARLLLYFNTNKPPSFFFGEYQLH